LALEPHSIILYIPTLSSNTYISPPFPPIYPHPVPQYLAKTSDEQPLDCFTISSPHIKYGVCVCACVCVCVCMCVCASVCGCGYVCVCTPVYARVCCYLLIASPTLLWWYGLHSIRRNNYLSFLSLPRNNYLSCWVYYV